MNFKNTLGAVAIATAGIFAAAGLSHAAIQVTADTGTGPSTYTVGTVLNFDESATLQVAGSNENSASSITYTLENNSTNPGADIELSVNRFSFLTTPNPDGFLNPTVSVKDSTNTEVFFTDFAGESPFSASGSGGFALDPGEQFTVTLAFAGIAGKGAFDTFNVTLSAVPLPAGVLLLLGGLGVLGFVGRRRRVAAA